MARSFSKEKTLGSMSPDQFARTLSIMDGWDSWSDVYSDLKQKPRFIRLIESPRIQFSWSLAYELDYPVMLALLICVVGEQAAFDRLAGAVDKHEEVLKMAEEEPTDPGRVRPAKALFAVGLLMALGKSAECMSLYSVSMNELVARVRVGNLEALLRAVTVDPTVLSAPSAAHQLSLAVMRKDKLFLRRLQKALSGPHKGRHPYKKLRFSALMLEESGAMAAGNREHVFDVVTNQLRLYEQRHGDAFKGLFTQFARWKADAAT
jgi:hypothetical protein